MQRLGFIHDMLDVKVLILFVASHSNYPMTMQEIYELSFQDECLSYFDVCTAIPEMVRSGHLREIGNERYTVTEKGREQGAITEDSIAYTVKIKAMAAVDEFNHRSRRQSQIRTRIKTTEKGETSVVMSLENETGKLMKLELSVPGEQQAQAFAQRMAEMGENLYHIILGELIENGES